MHPPKYVNKNIKRRYFPLNTIEAVAATVSGWKYFTRLDCTKDFSQEERNTTWSSPHRGADYR